MDKAKPKVKPKAKPLPYPVSFPAEKTEKVPPEPEGDTLKYPVPPVMEPTKYARGGGIESRGKTRGRMV